MNRFLSILLLVGLCLPMLFEGCKKPEGDPVVPGGTTPKDDTPGYFHLKLQTIEANQNVGLLIVDIKYQQLSKKYDVRGRYVQFNLRDFSTIRSVLQQLRSSVAQADESVFAYLTLTNLALKHFEKLPGYVRSIELKPNVLRDLMGGKAVQFGYNGFQRSQSDEWYVWVGNFLQGFVATPAQAQTISEVVGAKTRAWEEMYGSTPSQAQIDRFEQKARFDGHPEENWRTRMPTLPPPSTGGSGGGATTGFPTSLPVPSGVCPSVSTSALTDFLNGMNGLVSDVAGLLGNLGTSTAEGIQQTVDSIKAEFDRLVAKYSDGGGRVAAAGCSSRSASGTQGDPLIVGLDGGKQLLHPAGEFWAIHAKNDEFAVQVRFEPVVVKGAQTGVSTTRSIAIRTGKDVVSITVLPLAVHINGQEIKADFTSAQLLQDKAFVTRPAANRYEITTTWGDLIEVRTSPTFNLSWYVRVLNDKRRNQVEGLLGQYNGTPADDFQDKSGLVYKPPLTTYNRTDWYSKFCNDWRIKTTESILVYPSGKTTESYTIADFPFTLKHLSLFDFDLPDRNKAEQTCRRAGITQEGDLSDCMLDVLVTGRDEMADQQALGIKLKEESATYFQRLSEYPGKAAEGAVGLTVGDKIYAGLGKTSIDWAMYDPATDKWTSKTAFPGGKSSYARISAFVIGNKIYCVGGIIDGTMTNALWEYDTSTDKWTRRKDLPGAARFNIASFSVGGKGYALFGTIGWGNVGDFPTNSAVYQYDPATDTWTQKADFPAKPRGNNITSTEFNGMVMVINGRPFLGGGSGGGAPGNDWYEYIPTRDAWEKRANIVFDDGQYFSVGTTGYLIRGNALFSYDATADTWSKFPGKEIYVPLAANTLRGIKQAPVLNGKTYLGLGYLTSNQGNKEWWSFTP